MSHSFAFLLICVDVVIGAPFEENGQGAVYVYMGYKRGFFQTQKISAANVAPAGTTLKAFGSAFTQHPVDFNGDKHSGILDLEVRFALIILEDRKAMCLLFEKH